MTVMPNVPQLLQRQDVAFSFWCGQVPEGALAVTAFAAEEAISGLTRTEVLLSSKDGAIDLNALLDTPATLSVHHKYLPQLRHFSGVVVEAERGDSGHHRTAYRLTLLPVLYRLDIRSDCRIFQGRSVPDIARLLFAEHGIENIQWEITDTHALREYCVCYRETLLAFIERIFAEEGIFYFLRHDDRGRHTIVICDRPETLPACPGQEVLAYNAMASGSVKGVYCSRFAFREKLATTRFVQRDYTFKAPEAWMEQTARPSHLNGAKQDYELYDYPGRYKDEQPGRAFTRNKIEAVRVDASLAHGTANTPLAIAGHAVTLSDHPDGSLNRRWRLLAIRHEGIQPQAFAEDGMADAAGADASGAAAGGPVAPAPAPPALIGDEATGVLFNPSSSLSPGLLASTLRRGLALAIQPSGAAASDAATGNATLYACAFTAQSSILPYRPPQRRKPLVDGPQIAKVVGPPGEEIYCDEHGRVKVQFPWDRYGKADDNSSCFIRVSQNWAGATWGHIAIPRIGHEVIVDFLEGDPDQPIITGRTYHANNRPPYKLPDNKTRMVIRSDTHKGNGFNEISFEDQVGQENQFFHAQKDQTIKVLNNRAKRVNANQVESVGANKSIDVGGNHQEKIGGSMNLSVGGSGGGLLGALAAMIGGSGKQMETAAKTIGDPIIASATSGMAEAGAAAEVASLGANGAFSSAGDHFVAAGTKQASTSASLGGLLSKIMPLSGIMNTIVEKIKSDTIGLMRTEQVGLLKNTMVGHTQITSVGKFKKLVVGDEYVIEVGKSKMIMRKDGTVIILGTNFNFTASGPVQINGEVVDVNKPGS